MEQNFNRPSENSMGFVIKVSDKNDIYMDVKNIALNTGAKKIFPVECIHYLLVLNMSKSHRIEMNSEFQEFITSEVGYSRAYLFKVLKAMVKTGMLSKTSNRGWYKLNGVTTRKKSDL